MANWIPSTRARQKESLTVYCFTCACVFNDCLIQRREGNYQGQLLRVTSHMGCNYSMKEYWFNRDRPSLRDLITRALAAKITSRKKVLGEKVFWTGLCVCQSTVSDTGKLLCRPVCPQMDSCSPCVPQTLKYCASPCWNLGCGTIRRHSPALQPGCLHLPQSWTCWNTVLYV